MARIEADILLENQTIHFNVAGVYDIFLSGGFYFKNTGNFNVSIVRNSDSKEANILIPLLRLRSWNGGTRAIKYGAVDISQPGDYELKINNIKDLRMHRSMLSIQRMIFPWLPEKRMGIYLEK